MFIVMPPDVDGERVAVNFANVGVFGVEGNFLTILPSYGTEDYCIEYSDAEKAKEVCNHLITQLGAARL